MLDLRYKYPIHSIYSALRAAVVSLIPRTRTPPSAALDRSSFVNEMHDSENGLPASESLPSSSAGGAFQSVPSSPVSRQTIPIQVKGTETETQTHTQRSSNPNLRPDSDNSYNSDSSEMPEKWAVNGISMTLKLGECFGLLGPNGAGKSTTISILIGRLKASMGKQFVAGHDLGGTGLGCVHRDIGVCPQHGE